MEDNKPNYLLYVRNCFQQVFIYRVYCKDMFHAIGEKLYRTMEQIEWFSFFPYSLEREERFKNEYNFDIYDFHCKYGDFDKNIFHS